MGLTTRDVDTLSRRLAVEKGNEDYMISHARLVQIESGESTPSVYKLYSLSVIYGCSLTELLSFYIDTTDLPQRHLELEHPSTHVFDITPGSDNARFTFPIRFDPAFDVQRSALLSRMVELWGEVPVALLQKLDIRRGRWGYIGMSDFTMFPLLRPGSIVQIDDSYKPVAPTTACRSEYDRPIYFVELRNAYFCSWCEFHKGRIVSVPHPLSGANTREFQYPAEATLVGRVTAVATRLVNSPHTAKPDTQPLGVPKRTRVELEVREPSSEYERED